MSRRGVPLTSTPKFTPARDRKVDAMSVACPSCLAAPGEHCLKLDGSGVTGRHPTRRRLAVRRLNEATA